MPVGPFAKLGKWKVFEHDGSVPNVGPASQVTIVQATRKWIKYKRKCNRYDPLAERLHHGKVNRWDANTFRVSIGGFQYIEAKI